MAKLRLIAGLLLITLNFILGKAALPILAIDTRLSILIYALSWLMLICGIAICGKEGWDMAQSLHKRYWNRVIQAVKGLDWDILICFFFLIGALLFFLVLILVYFYESIVFSP